MKHLIAVLLTLSLLPMSAAAVDLHRLWDDRCADCHGHSGQFARHFLSVVNGELRGRHADRDLSQFMQNHYLKNSEIDPVLVMLQAQAVTEPLFQTRCQGCHGNAAEFARDHLELREGVVYGRGTQQPVGEFLRQHARLSADEAAFFTNLLTRVHGEVQSE
jgi:hypothetical protein